MKLMPSYMTQSRSLTYDLIKVSLLFVKVGFYHPAVTTRNLFLTKNVSLKA